jgi:hypothetical protein
MSSSAEFGLGGLSYGFGSINSGDLGGGVDGHSKSSGAKWKYLYVSYELAKRPNADQRRFGGVKKGEGIHLKLKRATTISLTG